MAPTAIVTGAARGIGKAIALRLARDGYSVTVNDLAHHKTALSSLVDEIRSLPHQPKAHAYSSDVTDQKAVNAMVQSSVEHLGPLNTMVANAGIVETRPILDITPEDYHRMFSVNLFAVHYCYAEATRQFLAQGPPSGLPPPTARAESNVPQPSAGVYKLIGGASTASYRPFPYIAHYCASKAAVRNLTQCFANEYARKGITANTYNPGIVGTTMWEKLDAAIGEYEGKQKGETVKEIVEGAVRIGRVSVPEDVSDCVHFLASKDSDYMTGQSIVCDGGMVFT